MLTATAEKYPELVGEGLIRGYDVTHVDSCEFCAKQLTEADRVWVWYMDSAYWYLVPIHRACHQPEHEDPSAAHIWEKQYADPGEDDVTFTWEYENPRYEP